eukprot:3815515-Prymnesium_polylepis.1
MPWAPPGVCARSKTHTKHPGSVGGPLGPLNTPNRECPGLRAASLAAYKLHRYAAAASCAFFLRSLSTLRTYPDKVRAPRPSVYTNRCTAITVPNTRCDCVVCNF